MKPTPLERQVAMWLCASAGTNHIPTSQLLGKSMWPYSNSSSRYLVFSRSSSHSTSQLNFSLHHEKLRCGMWSWRLREIERGREGRARVKTYIATEKVAMYGCGLQRISSAPCKRTEEILETATTYL